MGYNCYVNSKLITTSLILIFSLYYIQYEIFTINQPFFLLPPLIKNLHSKVLGFVTHNLPKKKVVISHLKLSLVESHLQLSYVTG
jgi:hypothetical protein